VSPDGLLLVAGVAALGLGAVAGARRRLRAPALVLQGAGVAASGLAGAVAVAAGDSAGAGFRSALGPAFGLDPLSGFFLVVLAAAAVPAAAYARGSLAASPRAGAITALTGLFQLALIGLVTARDPSTLLASWELMTLLPAAAILVARPEAAVRRSAFEYLAIAHVGGTGVWLAVLVLADRGALGGDGLAGEGMAVQAFVAVAALVGFGTKAGLMPLHAWLPRAHPVAPSHLSALMSGVMIKVAIYGLVRVLFEWAPAPGRGIGLALLALGALSALGGVLYALVQHDLKRLLAFHSIENVGIIALGLGASLVLAGEGRADWAALAFAAALLHTLNHAVFKALLFLAAGAFERAAGTLDIDRMGGLLRRMPWTGGAFLVGCAAIAGLPPLNGFASEWLTLRALLQLGLSGGLATGLAGALALAALAATAALALLCFAKVVGLVLLGAPRAPRVAEAREVAPSMRAATAALAAGCVLLGLGPGLLVPALTRIAPGGGETPLGAGLAAPGTGTLPTLAIAAGLAVLVTILATARRRRRAAPAPVWNCGQVAAPELAWTSAGFTKVLRLSLQGVLRADREVEVRRAGPIVQSIRHSSEVRHLFDTALYAPVRRASLRAAAGARRLQSGSLRAYAAFVLALLAVLLALARLGSLA
jgi:hydrogenase-4 component B